MDMLKISIIDLERSASEVLIERLRDIFTETKAQVVVSSPRDEKTSMPANRAFCDADRSPDVVLVILPASIGDREGSFISALNTEPRSAPVIAICEAPETGCLIKLYSLGIRDYIVPPLRAADVIPRVLRLAEHCRKKRTVSEKLKETLGLRQLIGESPAFAAELKKIPFVADCDLSVLITGETGTGKEMFARAIHYLSARAAKPFTPVNCGAIPTELIENELFGHVRGAYTSAVATERGLIGETAGGTLFLDEIDCLTPAAQVKLLRFLQEKEYRALGSAKMIRADVKIVAATNNDLEKAIRRGSFRQDLYYRLNIVHLMLPPLRMRKEDIPLLARHFLQEIAEKMDNRVKSFSAESLAMMGRYNWPGNIRELENVVKRTVIFAKEDSIQPEDIALPHLEPSVTRGSFQAEKARVVAEFEKRYMREILNVYEGNITRAANAAKKNRRAFWELMRKHNIDVRTCRPASLPSQDIQLHE